MLYVFHVDAGLMTTYDMNLTLQSVACLKSAIERKTKIPASSLVLLVSGGEVLQSEHVVSSYSAGTDSNPIYMFSKPSVKESHLKQSMELSPIVELSNEFRGDGRSAFEGKSVAELKASVEKCFAMPATVHTVISCANLAQQFSDAAHEVAHGCEELVHEQHLQHQGWSAVVANLEDIYNEFCERSRNFKECFRKHRLKKEEYHEKLNAIGEVLDSLGKIPLLPALQVNAEAHRFSAFDIYEEGEFEGHPYRTSHRLDSCSSDAKAYQDFGVDALKLSEEEVFDDKEAKDVAGEAGPEVAESDEGGVTFKAHSYETKEEATLLHWILAQGNKASLQDIIDYCQKGLTLIDAEPLKEHEAELYNMLEYANMHGLKQIKGIEERLFALGQLLNDARKLARDQHDQAASLTQYRERLNAACDPTVLPTLVQSHHCQLEKLLKGHQTLVDIKRRITKSKDELSHILKARLGAVLKIENSMSVQDAHAMLSFQCLNRLARYFGIVAQLHRAPAVFVRAVHEAARRRTFSKAHTMWAADLASNLLKIHEEEVTRRQEFNSLFESHFLRSLFPGMTDLPPVFATHPPSPFDDRIPNLDDTDVDFVTNSFPDLVKDVPTYDMEKTVKFFQQRVSVCEHDDKDVDVQVDMSKDESETETSDFERLSRQGSNKQKADMSTICVPETMAVSTVTEVRLPVILEEDSPKRASEFEASEFYIEESLPSSLEWGRDGQDNMDTHKINMERLQDFLQKVSALCRMNLLFIKEELSKLKEEMKEQKRLMNDKYSEVVAAFQKSNDEHALRFREETQRLTVDHELELSDMKAALSEKDDIIESLKKEKEDLLIKHEMDIEALQKQHESTKKLLENTREEIKLLEMKLEEKDVLKQKEIKELQEKMHLDYKAEIESLRSRFRLVALTNMDRSPSESSLEKIERSDVIEISSHNAIVMQTKENAEVEREEAVRRALTQADADWQQRLDAHVAAAKAKMDSERQVTNEATRRLLSEKDRQLELLREREQNMTREITKYRDTIQQLTDPETNDYDELVKTQMASLENEKAVLQQQVQELKKELDSEKSREDDSDERWSPRREEVQKRARGHTPLGLSAGTLSLAACLPGHVVLVMWEPAHLNYTVLQEAPIMYFVHSDCLPALDLSIQVKSEAERRLYAVATVESKEFCYAKKSGNRYHMPRGSRFYRVRVKPLRPAAPAHPPCCDPRHKTDLALPLAAEGPKPSAETIPESREVATAPLIDLDSPAPPAATTTIFTEQLDSIEASEQWQTAKMQLSTASVVTDMECSVGRVGGEPSAFAMGAAGAFGAAGALGSQGALPSNLDEVDAGDGSERGEPEVAQEAAP